jgi:hypothetical protein
MEKAIAEDSVLSMERVVQASGLSEEEIRGNLS